MRVCDPDSLVILHSSSRNRNILGTLFEVDRGAKTMLWHLREVPNISRAFDVLAGKGIIKEGVFDNILDNTKPQVIVALGVGVNRPALN